MKYLEIFLQIVFTCLIVGCVLALVFAVIAEFMCWYDGEGRYNGPFSKSRRK